jgi:hypothetical protein
MELIARLRSGETLGDRIVKVNHAGEHGAINIYRGQLLTSRVMAPRIFQSYATFWPRAIAPVVSGATEMVIWLGMRL